MTPDEVNPYRSADEPEPYRCPVCGKEFKTTGRFRRHLERHVEAGK